ncbi:peptidoglycan DD-metalloendopeptidase family protein [Modestobacter muralis]|uniref:Peptidoglycan DD-metalloendopeptidase family protein n=1 Tax=Modestobacter muralis TaxID=1608614 RepID=A0A6P0EQL2_9ACTN|nr:M23 family metallopeptidase [Modestobacter muralis]NEK93397.1 peptidoglycan DD-metalloendopeptidase family protein [Modestobacter muralis]NEN50164.1 peptidoglycan DD-metalloendopeptidase family protein [Modestobacter muralis]
MEFAELATSHDIVLTHHRRPGRSRLRVALIAPALATSAAVLLALTGPTAQAAPGEPVATASQVELADAEAALRGMEESVLAAEETLQRLTVEAEAVADASLVAQAELSRARQEADARVAELSVAQAAVESTQADVAALGRQSYMGADAYGAASAFFGAASPDEVLDRAATLEHLGDARIEQLEQLEVVEVQQQAATEAAKAAVDARDAAAQAAAEAERVANDKLAAAQQTYDAAVGEKAALEQQLQQARERVATLAREAAAAAAAAAEQDRGAAVAAAAATERARSAAAAAAPVEEASGATAPAERGNQAASRGSGRTAAGTGIPTTGRVTSCYGDRWGTTHYGVDIAAPIGTPIYAPEAGVVLQAGPASGFGLAVYLQHADGSITLYGHISSYSVAAGQQVSEGQEIAQVGNTGQSTGPHLHFEVHQGGLYQNRTNPVPWLAARGLSVGGSCS